MVKGWYRSFSPTSLCKSMVQKKCIKGIFQLYFSKSYSGSLIGLTSRCREMNHFLVEFSAGPKGKSLPNRSSFFTDQPLKKRRSWL